MIFIPIKLDLQEFIKEQQKKKEQLASLSEWIHFDCLQQHTDECSLVDDVLKSLMIEQEADIRPARLHNTLLETIDLSNLASFDASYEKTPGGVLSFVFQKKTLSLKAR